MNIEQAFNYAVKQFIKNNIDSATIDARLLIQHALKKSAEYIQLHNDQELTDLELEYFMYLIHERCYFKPIAYIIGQKEFYGRDFVINNHVLIPRADTEVLVEAALTMTGMTNPRILELGVGSGCIIISLLLEIPGAVGFGCDVDQHALAVASNNCSIYKLNDRLQLLLSDWFSNIQLQKFDIIISNPPYIATNQISLMSQETFLYEPKHALFAEDNGLSAYRQLARNAHNFLNINGVLFLEIGFDQLEIIQEIFDNNIYILSQVYKDINNHSRVLKFELRNKSIV